MSSISSLGVRKAYLDWRTTLHHFKFADSFVLDLYSEARHFDHLLLDKNAIFFSQGDGDVKVLASDRENGTVRLWSLSSSEKCGQQALKATFYGH
ncbi:hypothetical protein CRYUN_Cryun30bG0072700 [Craigia yunnanensis]